MSTAAKVLTVFLGMQALALLGFSRSEYVPPLKPLTGMAESHGDWKMVYQGKVDEAQQEVLKADDTLLRAYMRPGSPLRASLFIASFSSQRTGRAPHSPRNCLPGAGWAPTANEMVRMAVAGRPEPIEVQRYVIQKGDQRSAVYYWYQSRDRTVAGEYWAKYYVVVDSIRHNRSDTALVRVIVDAQGGELDAADAAAREFVGRAYGDIRRQLPQ